MKAARFHQYGGPEVIQIDEVPAPEPGEGEIQIKVAGYGINPFDWKILRGYVQSWYPVTFPVTLGSDVSGTVTKVGPGVTQFKEGDKVFGSTGTGAAAEYAVLSESKAYFAPSALDLNDASAVPAVALTAWQALFDHADLQAGQKVLIHAGAGGIGSVAIQLAKWKGAYVIATGSPKSEHYIKELGADEFVDYTAGPVKDSVSEVDVVLDTIGKETGANSIDLLKKGGILVNIVPPLDLAPFEAAGKRATSFSMTFKQDQLREISGLIEDLKLLFTISTELPLSRVAEAIAESESGHARGKIVVKVA